MSIGTTARFNFRWFRRTEFLLKEVAVSPTTGTDIDKCPQHDALIEVKVIGPVTVGTVTLNGKVDGVPTSEVLTFDGNTTGSILRVSCTRGLCATVIDTTGFAGGTISARYVGSGGEGIHVNCELLDCIPGHREYGGRRGTWKATTPGPMEGANGWIAFDDVWDYEPRPGDVFVEIEKDETLGRRWEVEGRPNYEGPLMPMHWECDVKLNNKADITVTSAL